MSAQPRRIGRAVECRTCGATHRDDVPCPPIGRWLISGKPVEREKR